MEWMTILPNLSIGVVSVIALVYVTREFIRHIREIHKEHMEELKERETYIRSIEREVRTSINTQLSENTRIMERVVSVLDKH